MKREGEATVTKPVPLEEDHLVRVRETLGGGDEVTTGPEEGGSI